MNLPYDVRLEDLDNMSLYTLAMVFYMYELTPTHDPVAVRNMPGEMPGNKVSDLRLQVFLLDQGFTLHHISDFDRERFLRDGRHFLMDFYGKAWTGKMYEYWTDERVIEYQDICRQEMSILSSYSGRWSQDVRSPEFRDVINLVSSGYSVLSTHSAGSEWLRLSWAMNTADSVRIFEPRRIDDHVSSLETWNGETGFVAWAVSDGLLAISR